MRLQQSILLPTIHYPLPTIHRPLSTLILLLDVFLQRPRADLRPVNGARGIGRHAFGCARSGFVRVIFRVRNEGDAFAVSGVPDTDAALPARIPSRIRL